MTGKVFYYSSGYVFNTGFMLWKHIDYKNLLVHFAFIAILQIHAASITLLLCNTETLNTAKFAYVLVTVEMSPNFMQVCFPAYLIEWVSADSILE